MLVWLTASVIGAAALWVLAAIAVDRYGTTRSPADRADALVVPGCLVLADGSASPHLRRRVARAVELYHDGVAPLLVLTGGPPGRTTTEAAAAGVVARELGVPDASLQLEERAGTTEQNARYTFERTEKLPDEVRRVVVVTDSYQVLRAVRVFSRHYEEVSAAAVRAPFAVRGASAMREVLALGYYRLKYGV